MKKLILNYHFWIMGLLSFILHSCNTKHRIWIGTKGEQKVFNLKYGQDKRQVFDLFLPEKHAVNTPIVILIHGGAWSFGRKEHMIMLQKMLFQNGIPSININYRLVNKKIIYKDQLSDIKSAIVKMNSLAEKAHLLPNNYIILGESAGAHLALLYGYENPKEIKKIISLSGPTDFYSDMYLKHFYSKYSLPKFQKVVGEKFDRKNISEKFVEASPISKVSDVPTLLFQGDQDFLVNKSQGITLDSILTEKKIRHQFIFMKKTGHTPRFFSKKKRDSIIYPAIMNWIKN